MSMKIITVLAAALILQGCEQVRWRITGTTPLPAERLADTDIDTVAEITLAGPRDRVEQMLHLIVERDPQVMTLVEIKTR